MANFPFLEYRHSGAGVKSSRFAIQDSDVNIKNIKNARLLVVGDVMLDRYWYGEVKRISPEAPVPVVRIDGSEDRPGGAANVARNATVLGAGVTLLSVV